MWNNGFQHGSNRETEDSGRSGSFSDDVPFNRRQSSFGIVIPADTRRGSEDLDENEAFTLSILDCVKAVGFIYALLMSLIGLIIPVAEALTNSWLNTVYGAVFTTYQLVFGSVFLIYLQLYLLRQKKPNDKDAHSPPHDAPRMANRPSIIASASPGENGTHESEDASSPPLQITWMDMSRFGDVFSHEGSSLFVRIGALVFSLGNLIYYGFEIATYMMQDEDCKMHDKFGWTAYFHFIFVIIQTYFMFKSSAVSVTKHVPFFWFGMLHLVSTNICLWCRTAVYEILHEIAHHDESHDGPRYNSSNDAHPSLNEKSYTSSWTTEKQEKLICDSELVSTISKYVFPFILEYSLLAVGTITSILGTISSPEEREGSMVRTFKHLIRVCSLNTTDTPTTDEHSSEENSLSKSHGGFFLGALASCGVIVSLILFFFFDTKKKTSFQSTLVFLVADVSLQSSLLISCIIALILMRPLAYVAKSISTDDVLLVIAMSGSVLFKLADIFPSANIVRKNIRTDTISALRLTSSIQGIVLDIVQLLLLLCALRRYPAIEEHIKNMPGRGAITYLIIGNSAHWVLGTVLTKSTDMSTESSFYGELSWVLLMNINFPFALFFRFHCSVCFAEVWHTAYTPLHHKLHKTKNDSNSIDFLTSPRPSICFPPPGEASLTPSSSTPPPSNASISALLKSQSISSPIFFLGQRSLSSVTKGVDSNMSNNNNNSDTPFAVECCGSAPASPDDIGTLTLNNSSHVEISAA